MAEREDGSPFVTDAEGAPVPSKLFDSTATPDVRAYAMWIHLGTLIATIVLTATAGIPFALPLIVALIMWLARKADHGFIDDHGREATNFQISLVILYLISAVIAIITCGVGAILTLILSIINIIGLILAAIAANKGQIYRYPVCIRLIGPPPERQGPDRQEPPAGTPPPPPPPPSESV